MRPSSYAHWLGWEDLFKPVADIRAVKPGMDMGISCLDIGHPPQSRAAAVSTPPTPPLSTRPNLIVSLFAAILRWIRRLIHPVQV